MSNTQTNSAMNPGGNRLPQFDGVRKIALITGIVGLLISIPALIMNPEQFHRSYLLAYMCCLAIPLGCLALVMMHHLTGGGWGFIIRRILEAGTRTIWLMAILYLPMLVGLSRIYGWARPDAASIPVYQQKHFYLNVPFFMVRSVIYFALWLGLAWFLNKWSAQQDEPGNPSAEKKLEGISGPGLVLWGIAVTFSAVDLVMSLEPTWFSSIYGMMIMIVYALSAMAFVIFIARKLTDREPLVRLATAQRFNDLGNFLLTFVMLWAYLSFSQFLIIWSGNMPEEISWYMTRARGSWGALALVLIIFHFAIPFVLLLSRDIKRGPRALSGVAAALVVLTIVDIFWLTVPAFEPNGLRLHWSNFSLLAGFGGLWLWAFFVQLEKRPLVPAYDSRLAEVLEDHEHVHQI
jgi:hypothetical protein